MSANLLPSSSLSSLAFSTFFASLLVCLELKKKYLEVNETGEF